MYHGITALVTVTQCHSKLYTIRQTAYDFLLTFCSKTGFLSCTVSEIQRNNGQKSLALSNPLVVGTPFGVTSLEFHKD